MTVPTAIVPWKTRLEKDGGVIYDIFTMDAKVTTTACKNSLLDKNWPISGPVKASVTDLTADLSVKFPKEILEGDSLETEGNAVEFSGEGELALESGEALHVTETCPTM